MKNATTQGDKRKDIDLLLLRIASVVFSRFSGQQLSTRPVPIIARNELNVESEVTFHIESITIK